MYVADTDNNVIRKGWWSGTPPVMVLVRRKSAGDWCSWISRSDWTRRRVHAVERRPGRRAVGSRCDCRAYDYVLGVSYSFTTWPGAAAQFYRIQSR